MPEVAQLGDPVVLDCDYTLEESLDEGLVVKWFFNEKPTPIYQWIPTKKPQELGEITKFTFILDHSVFRMLVVALAKELLLARFCPNFFEIP